jgi:DNA invertase Pin-like site-specific DNA recombinase
MEPAPAPIHAGIYLRVSTSHQDTRSQLLACVKECERRGWSHHVYQDVASGAVLSREGLEQCLHAARRRAIGAIVVFGLTRLGRNAQFLYRLSGELRELGVLLVSVQEPWIGETSAMLGDLLIAVMGFAAELERQLLRERVAAGMAAARAKGVHIGRPLAPIEPEELADLHRRGMGVKAIARHLRVDPATVRRHLSRLRAFARAELAAGREPFAPQEIGPAAELRPQG